MTRSQENAQRAALLAPAGARPEWRAAKRIVIKIGSSLLVDRASQKIRATWLNALADDVAELKRDGRDVLIVSSGAIALGRGILGVGAAELELEVSQAAASVGQISLAHAYQTVMSSRGLTAAQILLTLNDTEERRRYLNARGTIETLLRNGAVPVVNENDTIATSEIRYGDNDRLSARVAAMSGADVLVLLSDVDGLYTRPPGQAADVDVGVEGAAPERLDVVRAITPEIEAMARGATTAVSRGGMRTKIEAARIATGGGTHMVIASGLVLHPLSRLQDAGCPATWFLAPTDPVAARKKWIGGQLQPLGSLTIDSGAVLALQRGKSLLPAGVVSVAGQFQRGDAVRIVDSTATEVARGLIAYDDHDARLILGRQTSEVASILGYRGRAAIVHRDDMVLTRKAQS
ncbi:MAG: glutamate 5-kinase [Pseudomonadota bacterium]